MRRFRRWLLAIFGFAALVAVGAGLVFVDYPQASAELPEALAEYRAEGLPWLASDIALPSVPSQENAAEPLRRAIAALPEKGIDYDPIRTASEERLDALPRYERAVELAKLAAKRDRLDFRRDWDLGSFVLFPEEAGVKSLVRALAARVELRAKKRDDAGAFAELETARSLARLVAQDHGIIPALVAVACENMVSGAVRRCLAAAAGDPLRLRRYRDWIARPAPLLDLHRYFRDEIFSTVATARNLDRMGIGTSWNPARDLVGEVSDCTNCEKLGELTSANVRRDGLPTRMRSRAYLARCLQMWTELSQETIRLNERLETIATHSEWIQERYASPPTVSHLHDGVLFPTFAQFGRVNRSILASRQLAVAYADALILHAQTGRWPTACALPDPLGDGYLQTRLDHGRFRVWSVGNNGIDDNGPNGIETKEGQYGDDLVAAYPPILRIVTKPAAPAGLPAPGLETEP